MGKMKPYVVQQGDYLAKLAARYSFDATEVWDDPANKDLRDNGRTPELLCPGDVLFVPAEPPPHLPLVVGGANRFSAKAQASVTVSVVFHRDGAPIAGEAFRAKGVGYEQEGKSDGDGLVKLDVTTLDELIEVSFERLGLRYSVRVGHLDPANEPSGQHQRLANLGYLPPSCAFDDNTDTLFTPEFLRKAALFDFQRAQGLTATAEVDDATVAALERAHKC
jgi:hypothetical protein